MGEVLMRGFFERRGREGFAENAKKKYQKIPKLRKSRQRQRQIFRTA
jgi:hypothetical protein